MLGGIPDYFIRIGICILVHTNPFSFRIQGQGLFDKEGECDSTLHCPYDSDNAIYRPRSQFTFAMLTTVPREHWRVSRRASAATSEGGLIVKVKVLPECMGKQTGLKYEYFLDDEFLTSETTGLLEDQESVWLHPPRSVIDEIMFSPFPEIRFDKPTWRVPSLMFGNRIQRISPRRTVLIKNQFRIVGKSQFVFKDKTIECDKIEITSRHLDREYKSEILFSQEFGFVYIEIHFINGESYSLRLIDYDPDYCTK